MTRTIKLIDTRRYDYTKLRYAHQLIIVRFLRTFIAFEKGGRILSLAR